MLSFSGKKVKINSKRNENNSNNNCFAVVQIHEIVVKVLPKLSTVIIVFRSLLNIVSGEN